MAAFVHRLRVRYYECDPQGIVFNANHIAYVDVAFTEMWREAVGSYTEMSDLGVDMVVADVHAAFRAPVHYDAELALALEVARFGRTSMTTRWVSTVGERVCVEGEVVHVWIDLATSTPIEIPERARHALSPFTAG